MSSSLKTNLWGNNFAKNQYLRNFPFGVHLWKLISAKKYFRIHLPKLLGISHLSSYLRDFVSGSFPVIKNTVYIQCIPGKLGKSLWGVLVFVFRIFPKTTMLVQKAFLYSCFLQKFGLWLSNVEPLRTLIAAFYFSYPNTVKILPLPCWFSVNNSETVKAVILVFCRIQ